MFNFIISFFHQAVMKSGILSTVEIALLFFTCTILPRLKWHHINEKWYQKPAWYYRCAWALIVIIALCFIIHERE